jgi:predicted lactoylglutathione lyase
MAARASQTVVFAVRGPIARSDLPGLCDRVCALLERGAAGIALCDVRGVEPDAVTVDALARLQLAAGRHGCQVRLRHASQELLDLVEFMGLADVLPDRPMSHRQGGTMTRNGSRKLFVNLAVDNLDDAVRFFSKLGFSFDPRFTDEQATCMVVGEDAFVMLLVRDRFKDFTSKELSDPAWQTEAIMALTAESREEVDRLADAALAAGASPASESTEMDFMYSRSFHDPDGHLWEVFWMDPSALEG